MTPLAGSVDDMFDFGNHGSTPKVCLSVSDQYSHGGAPPADALEMSEQ